MELVSRLSNTPCLQNAVTAYCTCTHSMPLESSFLIRWENLGGSGQSSHMLLSLTHPAYFVFWWSYYSGLCWCKSWTSADARIQQGLNGLLHLVVLVACCSSQWSSCCSAMLCSPTADLSCWKNFYACLFFTPHLTSAASMLNIHLAAFIRDAWQSEAYAISLVSEDVHAFWLEYSKCLHCTSPKAW